MTFTQRERFILHVTTLMTLHLAQKTSNPVPTMSMKKMWELISLFLKNRCRKLTRDDVNEIYQDIETEMLFSGSVFDMQYKETKPFKQKKSFWSKKPPTYAGAPYNQEEDEEAIKKTSPFLKNII